MIVDFGLLIRGAVLTDHPSTISNQQRIDNHTDREINI
jgi:hypothetical protein